MLVAPVCTTPAPTVTRQRWADVLYFTITASISSLLNPRPNGLRPLSFLFQVIPLTTLSFHLLNERGRTSFSFVVGESSRTSDPLTNDGSENLRVLAMHSVRNGVVRCGVAVFNRLNEIACLSTDADRLGARRRHR
jgi:hypothetical protein